MDRKDLPARRNFVTGLGAFGVGALVAAAPAHAQIASPASVKAYRPEDFTGADDAARLNAAITAALADTSPDYCTVVQLQARPYYINSPIYVNLNVGNGVRIRGAGSTWAGGTVLLVGALASGAAAIQVQGAGGVGTSISSGFEISDLLLQSNSANAGVQGLKIGQSGKKLSSSSISLIENVQIYGFDVGLNLMNVEHVRCTRVVSTANGNVTRGGVAALRLDSDYSPTIDLVFDDCWFVGNDASIANPPTEDSAAVKITSSGSGCSVGASHFKNCKFVLGRKTFWIDGRNGSRHEDIFINCCQFDNSADGVATHTQMGIFASASGSGGASINALNVSDSWFVNYLMDGVRLDALNGGYIANVNITSNYFGLCKNTGVACLSGEGIIVSNNTFADIGSGTYEGYAPVVFAGTCKGFVCNGNTHRIGSLQAPAPFVGYLVRVEYWVPYPASSLFVIKNNVGSCLHSENPVLVVAGSSYTVGENWGYNMAFH